MDNAEEASKRGGGLVAMPMMLADALRLLADLAVHSIALLAAGAAFLALWRTDAIWGRVLAFPAACLGLVLGFYLALAVFALLFVRRIEPGVYKLSDRRALRWLVADSFMRMFERSFLRGYVKDFAPQRYLFFRLLGARMDRSVMIGGDARVTDPWAFEAGQDTLIAALSFVTAHLVEGDMLVVKPIKLGARVTIGVRSVILPGVEVGDGAIIGAGALVTKDTKIPACEIWAGVPARKIGAVAAGQSEGDEARL